MSRTSGSLSQRAGSQLQPSNAGIAALRAATFINVQMTWWLPAHGPTRPRRWQNQVAHTGRHTQHKISQERRELKGIFTIENEQESQPQHCPYPQRIHQSHQILSTAQIQAF